MAEYRSCLPSRFPHPSLGKLCGTIICQMPTDEASLQHGLARLSTSPTNLREDRQPSWTLRTTSSSFLPRLPTLIPSPYVHLFPPRQYPCRPPSLYSPSLPQSLYPPSSQGPSCCRVEALLYRVRPLPAPFLESSIGHHSHTTRPTIRCPSSTNDRPRSQCIFASLCRSRGCVWPDASLPPSPFA